jgi:hypothetical protein
MARYRVTCITKREKYERILGLGCYTPTNVFLTFTEAQVIDRIENYGDTFYVERPTGHVVDLIVVKERDGTKYVKTEADGEKPDNLLSLPPCPAKQSTTSAAGALGAVVAAASHGPADWC